MAEDKISLAVLINNENIPNEIFSSSIDKYFGPQIEDFKNSSLTVCILSDSTRWIPCETNVATYIKSQWLFTTTFIVNKDFEFKVVICDNRNWNIIANEDKIETRKIKTSHVDSDKVLLIRINWNEELTFTIESLTDLYSMDESFIKSHYECPDVFESDNNHQELLESVQNLQTIKEDDDDESLNDSLQEIPKNEEKIIMNDSVESLQEKVYELENDSLGNSQNNIYIQSEQDGEKMQYSSSKLSDNDIKDEEENESLRDSLCEFTQEYSIEKEISEMKNINVLSDNDSSKMSLNNLNEENENIVDDTCKEVSDENTFQNVDNNKSLEVITKPDSIIIEESEEMIKPIIIYNENSDEKDFENNNENINIEYTGTFDEIPTEMTQATKNETLKQKKAARLLKIQSLLGVKSELQTIQKLDMENIAKTKLIPILKYEEDFENEDTIAMENDCFQCAETSIESPFDEKISILDPFYIYVADTKEFIDKMPSTSITEPSVLDIEDDVLHQNEMESPTKPEEKEIDENDLIKKKQIFDCEVINKKNTKEVKVGIISDEYYENEYLSPMEDQIQANIEFVKNFVEPIDLNIRETPSKEIYHKNEYDNEDDIIKSNENRNSEPIESSFHIENQSEILDEKDFDSNDILVKEIDIFDNFKTNNDKETTDNENADNTVNEVSVIISVEESPKYSNILEVDNDLNREEKKVMICDNSDIVSNDCKGSNSEDIEMIQPKVEDVVEMFEKLVLKEEEPLKFTKRYKTENENFNIILQKFESDNKDNDENLILNNEKDKSPENQISDITINKEEYKEDHNDVSVVNEKPNITENSQFSDVILDDNKNENKENESFIYATKIVSDTKSNFKVLEHKKDITEINELSRNLSLKDIKKIVKEKRERLAVNDDYKYPDSVTPTKVEHSLSKSPEYNVPFMDDEAFYNESWYEESNDRWTSLERPTLNNPESKLLTPASNSQTPATSKASIEIFQETEEEKPHIIEESAKKESKRKGFISLCGCVGGR